MTFGYAPRIEWDARVKGRGVVGIGEAADLIHHAQLTWMPAAERRRYALTGPPPPAWFSDMQPAPWITPRVIEEGRKLAGASLINRAAPVPPGQHTPVPAQTRRHVPPDVPPPNSSADPVGAAADPVPAPDGTDMITGIAAAAEYLGYGKPDSFRRARTRTHIPGETRTPDGRPAWTPHALRDWHSKLKIAGNRAGTPGPD
jgi:hypothetical protein